MCLNIGYNNKPKRATKDICVYKVVEDCRDSRFKNDGYFGKIITPYRHFVVALGETYRTKFSYNADGDVEMGLHTYSNYETAKNYVDRFGWSPTKIVRCVIPKGSSYHIGSFFGRASYASTRLKYVEFIN